jgi:hypothetical protein
MYIHFCTYTHRHTYTYIYHMSTFINVHICNHCPCVQYILVSWKVWKGKLMSWRLFALASDDKVGTGPKNSELMQLGDQLADEMSTKTGRRMAESTSCRGRRLSVAWPAQVQSECLSPRRQAWLLPQLFRCCFALFYLLHRSTFEPKFRWSTVKPVLYAFLELSQGFDAKAFIGQ